MSALKIYSLEYTQAILKKKAPSIGPLWVLIGEKLNQQTERFHEKGYFLGECDGEENLGYLKGTFMLNLSVEMDIQLRVDEGELRFTRTPDHRLRCESPKSIRKVFETDAGENWAAVKELIEKLVDKIYKDDLFFLHVDEHNASVLKSAHEIIEDPVLHLRMIQPVTA